MELAPISAPVVRDIKVELVTTGVEAEKAVAALQQQIADGAKFQPCTDAAPAPDHSVRAHHKNSPSKLPYLAQCAGFKSDETGDKDAAEQGTRLHEYMDTIVQNWVRDESKPKRTMLQFLEDLSRTVALDETERPLLVYCIRELSSWLSKSGAQVVQEIRVEIHRPDGALLTAGHLDILVLFLDGKGLLIDWKFGWLRVKDASENEQGLSYGLGCFEKYPTLDTLGVMFVQPRLNVKTSALMKRSEIPTYLNKIGRVVERAEFVQQRGFTAETIPMLQTGPYCMYCEHTRTGTCPARLGVFGRTASSMVPMEFPKDWSPESIQTPEQAAMARYAVERVEDFLEPLKQRAKQIALEAQDQKIGCKLANGDEVVYKIEHHKFDRSVGKALDVAKALENIMTLEEVLLCAELKLGTLEEAATNAIYEFTNEAERRELATFDEQSRLALAAGQKTKSAIEKERKAIRARYASQRITKKSATEQFQAILTTQGLLTRPDGTTPQLRRDKSGVKQLAPVTK